MSITLFCDIQNLWKQRWVRTFLFKRPPRWWRHSTTGRDANAYAYDKDPYFIWILKYGMILEAVLIFSNFQRRKHQNIGKQNVELCLDSSKIWSTVNKIRRLTWLWRGIPFFETLYWFNMKYWRFKLNWNQLKLGERDCNSYLYFYVKCLEVLPCFCPALKYHGYRKEADIK